LYVSNQFHNLLLLLFQLFFRLKKKGFRKKLSDITLHVCPFDQSRNSERENVKVCFPIYAIKGIEKYAQDIKTKGNGQSERDRA